MAELEENEHDSVVFVDSGARMSKDSGLQCYRMVKVSLIKKVTSEQRSEEDGGVSLDI